MSHILNLPQEIIDGIAILMSASSTVCLSLTCRTLSQRLANHLHNHAISPTDGLPALHWAVYQGHIPLTKYLFRFFPSTATLPLGTTLLQTACLSPACTSTSSTEMLTLLLSHNIPLNEAGHWDPSPLHILCSSRYARLRHIHLLITHGADMNQWHHHDQNPLRAALRSKREDIAILLIRSGADLSHWGAIDRHLVMLAAREGRVELLQTLLEAGENPNCKDRRGRTPLIQAAREGHGRCVEVLIRAGVDLDAMNVDGDTAALLAALHGFPRVVLRLLKCGARNMHGWTLLETTESEEVNVDRQYKEYTELRRAVLKRRFWRAEDVLAEALKVAKVSEVPEVDHVEIVVRILEEQVSRWASWKIDDY